MRVVDRPGAARVELPAGASTLRFTGRLSRRSTLAPGRYRLVLQAADAAGNRSAAVRVRFDLLARRP